MKYDKELIEAIKGKNLIIFAGAGVNSYLNLPDWQHFTIEVLQKLIDNRHVSDIDKRTYRKQKEKIEKKSLTPKKVMENIPKKYYNIVYEYIKERFIFENDLICPIHEKLLFISERIITTNYDNIFEIAYKKIHNGKQHLYVVNGNVKDNNYNLKELINRSKTESFIFKIHGSADHPDTCIIFKDNYIGFYDKNNAAKSIFEQFIRDYTILFIGWSFNDKKTKEVFDIISRTSDNNHYILTSNPADYKDFVNLSPIVISNYKDISKTLDNLLSYNKSTVRVIRSLDIFKNISDKAVDIISKEPNKITLKEGDVLVCEGDAANVFWIILKGKLKVIATEVETVEREKNDLVGELGFVLNSDRERTMICAKNNTELLTISGSLMEKLPVNDRNVIWNNIVRELVKKNAELSTREGDEASVWGEIAKKLANKLRIN